jgi:predicted ATPase
MAPPRLTEIRLKAFKSFTNVVLPVDAITVLIGRNSSGKSNALDGIEVLSRLASGEELGDALDGRRREGGQVRGGSRGCAPHGKRSFALGCTVVSGRDRYRLDITVQVSPELRITRETLRGPAPALESGRVEDRYLLYARSASESTSPGLPAEIHNGKRGSNPVTIFRDNRLLTSQLPARIVPQNPADEAVLRGADAVNAALRGVFHLDPVPHLMRDYVPQRDSDLRRTGENLSAAIARLKRDDPETLTRIRELVQEVADERIQDIIVTSSDLGDVMLALSEGKSKSAITPAREMSDGLLRFMALATALLTSNRGLDIDPGLSSRSTSAPAGVLIVIEELENGLHPSQAGRMLSLIQEASIELATQVMVTTHSPALLNAVSGKLTRSIIVCYRDRDTGVSQLTRLPELSGYATAMASGGLGDVVARGGLVRPETRAANYEDFNRLLGIE